MARETSTPVERGPGSISSQFDSPRINVATPGRQLQAQPTREEIFRNRIIAFGRGAAAAVSARATIDTRLKMLKDRSMAKVEADLNRASRAFQEKRLSSANDLRRQMIVEAQNGDRSLQDLERSFRSRMMNASSEQEAQLWEGAWRQAAAGVSRENEQERRQAFNSAKMTMQKVSLTLTEQLEEQPELRGTLMGDGTNIGARVQNWMLEEIQQSMDLEALSPEDAELLVHQAVVQSAGIADNLRETHQKQVEQSNLSIGNRQMASDIISTVTGEQDAAHLSEQIEVTLRDRLGHLTPEQQQSFVRNQVAEALSSMSSGDLGIDAATGIQQAAGVLNITVDGAKVFNAQERRQLETAMINTAGRTLQREAQAEVTSVMESLREVVPTEDGTIFRRNPAAEFAFTQPGPDGVSQMDMVESRMLAKHGLNRDDLTHEETLMKGAIRDVFDNARRTAISSAQKIDEDFTTYRSWVNGGDVDGNKAWEYDPLTRAGKTPDELTEAKNPPLSQNDVSTAKQMMMAAATTPEQRAAISSWQGETLEFTPENRTLNTLRAKTQASVVNQSNQPVPKAAVEDILRLSTGDEDELRYATEFVSNLSSSGKGWKSFADQLSASERTQMIRLREAGRLGQTRGQTLGRPAERDFTTLQNELSLLRNSPDPDEWLSGQDPSQEEGVTRRAAAAASLTDYISASSGFSEESSTSLPILSMVHPISGIARTGQEIARLFSRKKIVPYKKSHLSNSQEVSKLLQGLENTFKAGDSNTVNGLMRSYAGLKQSQPDLPDDLAWKEALASYETQGYKFHTLNEEAVLLPDPHGYFGPAGEDLVSYAGAHLSRRFSEDGREFIANALGLPASVEGPSTMEELLIWGQLGGKGSQFRSSDEAVFTPRLALGPETSNRLGERPEAFGGAFIQAETPQSIRLGNVKSVAPAEFRGQIIPEGVALNVINPLLYEEWPQPETPTRPFGQ